MQNPVVSEFIREAESLLNVPYVWGGNNPLQGLDCSGFICWLLKRFSIIRHDADYNAQSLYSLFLSRKIEKAETGALLFFGKSDGEIHHAALALSHFRMIQAAGGDSKCTDIKAAARLGAMVRRDMISSRVDLVTIVMPPFPESL